uniref:Large ribosomal subunit protein uL4c n=1 Tax=Osmundaria fimbriata TaxID=228265 RepID=A0A1Z1M4N7_OSMFI|nr:ribosomal protein L4 [Osmundaria fimbriata]ARW60870.1 ribosomal protein L4 [Osmundaria fimbriata]
MTVKKQLEYSIIQDQDIDKINLTAKYTTYLNISETQDKQMYCIHRALKQQLTNYRIRNAHSKTRSEVQGGGKKPWKQKGTGRARAGSTRSPLWKGGGVIFGPRKKIYISKINKKEKNLAIKNILYNKFKQTLVTKEIVINANKPNTKSAILILNRLGINTKSQQRILLIVSSKTKITYLSFRNIRNIELIEVQNINVLSLLKADIILITLEALKQI